MVALHSVVQRLIHIFFRNKLVVNITSNKYIQNLLYILTIELEYLQGIGSGADITTSGEISVVQLLQNKKKDNVIFDVGANTGKFTSMIDSEISDVEVHLFEPQSELASQLEEAYSSDINKYVNGFALADEEGESTLYYDKEGSGFASFSNRRLDHFDIEFDHKETVHKRTLDEYCNSNDINNIDLLKMDVEGHELDVLAGANEMISSGSIEYITFEFGGANIDSRIFFQDYYYFFDHYGYTIYRILPRKGLKKIDSYKEINEKFRTANYLASRSEKISS